MAYKIVCLKMKLEARYIGMKYFIGSNVLRSIIFIHVNLIKNNTSENVASNKKYL